MDLPDIKIVVQWKATCTLSTLWQRFGRGARGEGYRATGILLVGKQDICGNALKDEKTISSGTKKQKRKARSDDVLPEAKRPALTDKSINTAHHLRTVTSSSMATMDVDVECPSATRSQPTGDTMTSGIDAIIEECRARYARPEPVNDNMRGRKKRKVLTGSPIDDYINAHHSFPCRRIVLRIYFGNDKACTLSAYYINVLNSV